MQLNFKEFGQGEPIIILHGLFGTLDNWQTVAKRLAEKYWVFIVDQRNHGKSPHHPDFNYEILAEDLYHFMDEKWIHQAHIIGHSMGGKTAMQFAMNYPDMVDKLIVVDIGPKGYKGGHQTIFEAMLSLNIDSLISRKEAEEHLNSYIKEKDVVQFLLKNINRKKEGGFKWKMNLDSLYKNYESILAPIGKKIVDVETLFINGALSNYIQEEDKPFINTIFKNSKFTTIEKAGHWVHAEQPMEMIKVIHSFLD